MGYFSNGTEGEVPRGNIGPLQAYVGDVPMILSDPNPWLLVSFLFALIVAWLWAIWRMSK